LTAKVVRLFCGPNPAWQSLPPDGYHYSVFQPQPFSKTGQTVVTPWTAVKTQETAVIRKRLKFFNLLPMSLVVEQIGAP
jgi:hypothetical protein